MKTYTTTIEKPRLKITNDIDSESPRTSDNLGYFITIDQKCSSPDSNPEIEKIIQETAEDAENQDDHINLITARIEKELDETVIAVYPIVKHEHTGIIYRIGTQYGFDYSNNGFYIVTERSAEDYGAHRDEFKHIIADELDIYNKYINGEVYAYALFNENGEIVSSCGGFYDIDAIKAALPQEWKKENMWDYVFPI